MTPPREPHVATEATATSSDVPVVDPRTGAYDDATPWSGDAIFACAGEMAERMAAHPWDRNVLGPPAQWPPVLRTTVSMVLRSKYPITLTWGEQFVMLYNDAYVPVLTGVAEGYLREGKRFMRVAIGCTGGKHRSVAMTEEITRRLQELGHQATATHRDLGRE